MSTTVFLVDDDAAVLKGLRRLLASAGLNVIAFESPQDFLEGLDGDAGGCVVLDYSMPGLNGLELQQALAARGSALPVIFLTGKGDIPTSVRAMKDGAVDFLTKPVDGEVLLAAIRAAIKRDRSQRGERAERTDIERRLATLTAREREVLRLVVAGLLNKQIAAELGTVEKTVKVHRARVMEKMRAGSLAELVRLAGKGGLD
jgi:RNA polymerase sigma factor (sigma-70 family)